MSTPLSNVLSSPSALDARDGRCASFDFAQDEVEFDMPLTFYLILSEVEGRSAPMQRCTICA